jgi:hypothetical protein
MIGDEGTHSLSFVYGPGDGFGKDAKRNAAAKSGITDRLLAAQALGAVWILRVNQLDDGTLAAPVPVLCGPTALFKKVCGQLAERCISLKLALEALPGCVLYKEL